MERSSISKWLLLGFALFLVATYGRKAVFGTKASEHQPYAVEIAATAATRLPEHTCTLDGDQFQAVLSTQGAALQHFVLAPKQFRGLESDKPQMDLVTIGARNIEPKLPKGVADPSRAPLRTDLRLPSGDEAKQQVGFDDFDWKLDPSSDGKRCIFTYADASTSLKKTISTTAKPYELAVQLDVKNLASEPKKHRFTIEQTAWRNHKEVEGGFMKRQSEFATDVLAVTPQKTDREVPGDFEPGDFTKKEFTGEGWRRTPGDAKLAAVNSVYFTTLLVPEEGAGAPVAETRIEQRWRPEFKAKEDDPEYGYIYRARLAYPEKELAPQETATYRTLAYVGPKDVNLLGAIGHGAPEVVNLGYFIYIANWLVRYLHALYGIVGSWGVAIVVLTVTVRVLLFPLSLSQIKSSMAMRKLKPEMDELNAKYKDDAAQRGLAIQELWRKNNVSNPVVGCLPMLLQMPVWWALYSVLQSAVVLYHVPFLWFADLTAPDKYFIIPIVLGASSFFQQKLMPAQGDPQQQKMMQYMMPAIFVFMMLFLPAGLGVYMLTNSVLAIGQQLLVERYLKGHGTGPSAQIEVREKSSGDGDKPKPALGKGKASARG